MTWRIYELTDKVFVASTDDKYKKPYIEPIIMTQVASDPDIKCCRLYIWDRYFGDRIPYINLSGKRRAIIYLRHHYNNQTIDKDNLAKFFNHN